jgi:alkaline phosphatase
VNVIRIASNEVLPDTSPMRRVGLLLMVAACGGGAPASGDDDSPDAANVAADAAPARAPAVIVMIGDGMGMAQLDVASRFAHGAPGLLAMEALPVRGEVRTGGPSGITDSAAAATVMATGVYTYNGNVGVDRAEQPVETILERAAARGWATGVVTTTSLPHATPASFTAHVDSRAELTEIAAQQARVTRPDVMLGGGAQYFAGLEDDLDAAGYARVDDALGLAAAIAVSDRVFGAFAADHLTYVADRPADTTEPRLVDMAAAAMHVLDRDPDGFFLMIEGGRIDHAGHGNQLVHNIHETLDFDEAVAAVSAWARARGNTTVIVTADHECGGLELVAPAPAGEYPEVAWRWGAHTNARVAVLAEGPGAEVLDGAVVDHRWVYEIARARVDGDAFVEPARQPIPDGEFADLRHRAVVQAAPSGFGPGFNQLDALWVDAGAHGLTVGVEGLFEWEENALELWLDVDLGAATGPGGLAGAVSDGDGVADAILAASNVAAPAVAGFGVDLVVVARGGDDPHVEDLVAGAGLRGVRAPFGAGGDLGWHHAAINYGAVRTRGVALAPVPGQGLEVFVPWDELYPGGVPAGARVALAAVLVNDDGGYTSNQALPPFPAAAANPGRAPTALPGVVVYELDADGDGTIDGDAPPIVLP